MKQNDFVQELRKDIKVIKKDLRAISIKTRTMARALDVDDQKEKPNKKTTTTQNKISWLNTIIKKIKNWLGK
jgi:hypothetical protein|tara:strand:+ start:221 stop:436 length:216 start_codon:yes stop_codon:yes gene_type:complete